MPSYVLQVMHITNCKNTKIQVSFLHNQAIFSGIYCMFRPTWDLQHKYPLSQRYKTCIIKRKQVNPFQGTTYSIQAYITSYKIEKIGLYHNYAPWHAYPSSLVIFFPTCLQYLHDQASSLVFKFSSWSTHHHVASKGTSKFNLEPP